MMSSIFSCLVLCLHRILLSQSRRFSMIFSSCCCFHLAASMWAWRSLRCRKYFSFSAVDLPSLWIWRLRPALSVFPFVLQPCVWCFFDLQCASLLGELSEIQRLWVCILLSIQNTIYAGETCYRLPFDHTVPCKTNVEKQKRKSFNEVVVFRVSPSKHKVETRTFLFITLITCIADYKIVTVARTLL